ncbi:hypothetical protein BD626DRAFT_437228 [Schizophyllum amplum]|uniref:RING-type domain-containing protein n=1 Tax=Schizophyllum amplum TaxID=97359 RepID=A0A550C3A5_9AGAR|nr:hypothetical protein BD626DRAFT_437228 [Auriculariopsis ampla]
MFGAGATIQSVVTGFQTVIVSVAGLPADAGNGSLFRLIVDQDISPASFQIVSYDRRLRQSRIAVDAKNALQLVEALDDAVMTGAHLSASVTDGGGPDGMGDASSNDSVLSMWWRAPSVRYTAEYSTSVAAEAKAQALNGKFCSGRRVNVFVHRPRGLLNSPSTQIIIDALPIHVSAEEVARFAGSSIVARQQVKDYNVEDALHQLEIHIRLYGATTTRPVENTSRPHDKMVNVRAHFNDWNTAEQIRLSLTGKTFAWNGNWIVNARLDGPVQYKLSIPVRQYEAQKRQWDALAQGGPSDRACSLKIDAPRFPGRPHVFIQISGTEKQTVGQLKVRIEDLARGETLAAWQVGLNDTFLNRVSTGTGAFLSRDARTRMLKAFGESIAIAQAREKIQGEVDRLTSQEISFPLKPGAVSYFLRQGITALKEELGEDNAKLDGPRARCTLIVRGGNAARRAVERHLEESVNYQPTPNTAEAICPVCYLEASASFRLGCGHVYCTACAKHLLSSATENKTFPLTCIGDEATCGVPIPIPTIRKFLTDDAMNKLFDAAFAAHIERNPDKLKYCRTAACEQVYPSSGDVQQFVSCPSCFATICASCDEGARAGTTCAENARDSQRKLEDRLNETLVAEQNYKRCPSCHILVEKIVGCNHITCRCGTHFCWRCTQAFARDEIYPHMREVHGGIGMDEDVRPPQGAAPAPVPPAPAFNLAFNPEQILEQQRILVQIERQNLNRFRPAAITANRAPLPGPHQEPAVEEWRTGRMAEEAHAAEARRVVRWNRYQAQALEEDRTRRDEYRRLADQRTIAADAARREEQRTREQRGWGCTIM